MHSSPIHGSGRRVTLYDRRRTVWGVLAAILVVNLIVVFFTLRPSGLSLPQQEADLASLKLERDNLRAAVTHLERVQAKLADSAKQAQEFANAKFLLPATGYSAIIEELDKLAVANGVHKGAVGYGMHPVKDRPDIAAVEMNFSLDGEYPKIVRFINQMERAQLFMIVDSMSVARGEGRGVHLSVKLLTYFRGVKGIE